MGPLKAGRGGTIRSSYSRQGGGGGGTIGSFYSPAEGVLLGPSIAQQRGH